MNPCEECDPMPNSCKNCKIGKLELKMKLLKSENHVCNKIISMGQQSLSPDTYEKLEYAVKWIRKNRGLSEHKGGE